MWKRKITTIALVMTMFLCTGCMKGLIYKRSGDLVDDLYQNHYRPEIASEIAEEIISGLLDKLRGMKKEPSMEEQLQQAIENEQYELASKLRDAIAKKKKESN